MVKIIEDCTVRTFYGDPIRLSWQEVVMTSFHLNGENLTLNEIALRSLGLQPDGQFVKVITKKGIPQNPELVELRNAIYDFKKDPSPKNLITIILEIADLKYYQCLVRNYVKIKSYESSFRDFVDSRLQNEIKLACNFLIDWVSVEVIDSLCKLKYHYRFSQNCKNDQIEHRISREYLESILF